jgi:acyl-coenzyme A thioesterase PaaI-like protein
VVRATRSLIFMQTEISAAERIIATASGVFRIFNERTTASA